MYTKSTNISAFFDPIHTHTGLLVAQCGSSTYSVRIPVLHTFYDVRRHQYQVVRGTAPIYVDPVKGDCSSNVVSPANLPHP